MSTTFNAIFDIESCQRAVGPSCTFTNKTAAELLQLLNLPVSPCGLVAGSDIPEIRRSIIRALSSSAASEGGPRSDQERSRLQAIEYVLAYAQKIDGHVVWT